MTELTIHNTRGPALDTVHRVHAAVCRGDGTLVAWSGDAQRVGIMRSAAKPFQALPLAEDGVIDRFAITGEELALACASHNSEVTQVEVARGLLTRLGLSEEHLACGPHPALARDFGVRPDRSAKRAELAEPSRLASNCSGKHSGMLALALHHGWETDGYHVSGHPVQERALGVLARYAGMAQADIGQGVDGCGVVTFSLPLANIARAFAALGADQSPAARTIVNAMMQHPEFVAGQWRLDTELMQAYPGQVLAKVGAEGMYCAALPRQGLGLVLKVEDGSSRAAMPALLRVLDALGLEPAASSLLGRFADLAVLNTRFERVGAMRAEGGLRFA